MYLQPKTWNLIEKLPHQSKTAFPKNALFIEKIPFLRPANTGVKPPFLKISRLKLQNLCWPTKTES